MFICTCHQDGCPNMDIGIELMLEFTDEESGDLIFCGSVWCGGCNNPITDLQRVGEV